MRIDNINDQLNTFKDRNKRLEIKEKILSEMEKANQKENYFSEKKEKLFQIL